MKGAAHLNSGMGFHHEEEGIVDGTLDNRVKGKTILQFHFANHTSSLITLQGNPSRDLAGSLWKFSNPHAQMDEAPGEQCFFMPALCEGEVGEITYSRKREVAILPPDQHYDMLFDEEKDDPPTKIAPVLELEWFTQKFGQVQIDCEQIKVELVEMEWSLSAEEAAIEKQRIDEMREEIVYSDKNFYEEMELIEDFVSDDPDPHELEEQCFLIVQEFIINSANDSEEKQDLHSDLTKLQEQMAGAFEYYTDDDEFEDVPRTVTLLSGVLPFIDRACASSQFVADTTYTLLFSLRGGIVKLRDELARGMKG